MLTQGLTGFPWHAARQAKPVRSDPSFVPPEEFFGIDQFRIPGSGQFPELADQVKDKLAVGFFGQGDEPTVEIDKPGKS